MKNNKGFTLIELILSISLLALIATVFLTAFNHSIFVMGEGRKMTKESFHAQQDIEEAIEIAKEKKEDLYDGRFKKESPPYKLFGKDIEGVLITEPSTGSNTIKVYVPTEISVDEKLPVIDPSSVKITPKGPLYGASGNPELVGDSRLAGNSEHLFMLLKQWYVSDAGYDSNVPEDITNDNEGVIRGRYPMFPHNYQKIDDESTILNDLDRFIGRHIIYSVTPINKIGKFGIEEVSQPVYIMGPPVMNNIRFHLDPYTLRRRDGSNDIFIEDKADINNWRDYAIGTNFTLTNTRGNAMKLDYIYEDGKALILNDTQTELNYNPTNNSNFTLFVVYKNISENLSISQNIIKRKNSSGNNGWELRLNGGKIEFYIEYSDWWYGKQSAVITQTNAANNDKYIISAIVSNSNVKMVVDKNDAKEVLNEGFSYSVNNSGITTTFGSISSQENIYEVIVYNAALTDTQVNSIRQYLADKHRIQLAD